MSVISIHCLTQLRCFCVLCMCHTLWCDVTIGKNAASAVTARPAVIRGTKRGLRVAMLGARRILARRLGASRREAPRLHVLARRHASSADIRCVAYVHFMLLVRAWLSWLQCVCVHYILIRGCWLLIWCLWPWQGIILAIFRAKWPHAGASVWPGASE